MRTKQEWVDLMAICPRCDVHPLATELVHNALSRHHDGTYICSPCGEDEAVLDWCHSIAGGNLDYQPQEWPLRRALWTFEGVVAASGAIKEAADPNSIEAVLQRLVDGEDLLDVLDAPK